LASGAENKFAMAKMKKVGAEELSNEMRDLKASEQMSYMSGIGQAAQGIGSFGSALSASTTQSNWKPYVGY